MGFKLIPTLHVRNGDTLVVKVYNRAQYNATIHWHGIRQFRTGWADGPEFITQCPIRPGRSYTYRFTITEQEGTLLWHAHSSWLRASVNPIDVVNQATRTGAAPNISDAYSINGQPGDLYPCSTRDTFRLPIYDDEIHLLRVVNAALNQELFFSVTNHKLTVVAVDASYTKPFKTKYVMLGPGQTTDVILRAARHRVGTYYMAARAYSSAQGVPFDNTTTTAILEYRTRGLPRPSSSGPVMPILPTYNDTRTATHFARGLRSLANIEHPMYIPQTVDENLFYTIGLGLFNCPNQSCGGPNGTRFTASMNNISFVLLSTFSILQAHYLGRKGIFTTGFPDNPPVQFDYTAQNVSRSLWSPVKGTKVKVLQYNAKVQIILQDTNIIN
eukprot:PITA_21543